MATIGETRFYVRRYEILYYSNGYRDQTTVKTVGTATGLRDAVRKLDVIAAGVAERTGGVALRDYRTAAWRVCVDGLKGSNIRARRIHYYVTDIGV